MQLRLYNGSGVCLYVYMFKINWRTNQSISKILSLLDCLVLQE
jgi:hypothetical protein